MSEDDKTVVLHSDVEDGPVAVEVTAPRGFTAGSDMGTRHGLFGVHDDGDTTGFTEIQLRRQMPAESGRPYGSWFDEVVDILEELIEQSDLEIAQVI